MPPYRLRCRRCNSLELRIDASAPTRRRRRRPGHDLSVERRVVCICGFAWWSAHPDLVQLTIDEIAT